MAQTKNAKYKVHNGVDFDTIHFETKANQVKMADGSTVENKLTSHLAGNSKKHITESGSNASGAYIKFDDGTMICYQRATSLTPNVALGSAWRTDTKNWAYPATFAALPEVFASGENFLLAGASVGTDPTRCTFYGISLDSSGRTGAVNLYAIGRWK